MIVADLLRKIRLPGFIHDTQTGHGFNFTDTMPTTGKPLFFQCRDVVTRHAETQLVINAARQHRFPARFFKMPPGNIGDRYSIEKEACADPAHFQDMPKIGQQAVGDIDGGMGDSA